MAWDHLLWVGLGGGLGSSLRWQLGKLVGEHYRGSFPLATFIINISGALAFGYLIALLEVHGWDSALYPLLHAGLFTGFLGGYTTFSTLMLDILKLQRGQQRGLAWCYVLASVLLGLAAAWLGGILA